MKKVDVNELESVIRPVAEGAGYDLVDVEWKMEAGSWVLRVFIDRPFVDGADPAAQRIGLEDCTTVSRELSAVLDVSDVIGPAYSLEVSSPGINRRLKREADFRRFVGQRA